MKKFIYTVGMIAFEDSAPWGEAWRLAKEKATETHLPIFREVIEGHQSVRQEVFIKGRIFQSLDRTTPEDYLLL